MSAAPFTAVVVLHDSAADLARLLDSLERHLPEPPHVVAVDSGSRDDGPELARRRGAEVVALPGNPGFGAASNAGVERALADVTVLLNPDVELLDAGLLELVATARERDALVVPRLLNADGSVQPSAHPVPGGPAALLPALVPPATMPRALRARFEPYRVERRRTVGWAIAACVVARTSLLRRLGPFDPGQFLFYEDLDLCLRARELGVPTLLCPDVALRHAGAHATRPAFGGEPHELLARRRRSVVRERLGRRAQALDDLAQGVTFATRAGACSLLRRDATRERAQLAALRRARREAGE